MIRNNVCMNAHPTGCAFQVKKQVEYAKSRSHVDGPRRVLVIGSSTGYGLASRIISSYSCGAQTVGVYFERPGAENRTGSAGWYNNLAFEREAEKAGIYAKSINGDAFSDQVKAEIIDIIKSELGSVDLVIYSLAAPRRTDPETGETYRSVIKPIGEAYRGKSVDAMTRKIIDFTLDPATEEEVAATVKVMGGEDWASWIDRLLDARALAGNALTVSYSYMGPAETQQVYRNGTIGRAKEHLEKTAVQITERLRPVGGRALVSINKALVTRASAVIPVVPLYISLLFKVMKAKDTHENCIEQIYRLFAKRLYTGGPVPVDEEGRIRIDDLELADDVQREVAGLWDRVTTENLQELADLDGYWQAFLEFHGFGVDGVDYDRDVEL